MTRPPKPSPSIPRCKASPTTSLAALALLLSSLSAAFGQDAGADGSGTTARFANLLAFRDEARILLDGQMAVSNTVGGEVSDYAPIAPGSHRVQVIPCYGKGELLHKDFTVKAGSKTTLVLAGGPSAIGGAAPSTVIPLVYEKSLDTATGPDGKDTCTVIFANGDLRGPIKVGLKTPTGETSSFDLAPGKTQTFEKFPLAALDLAAAPLFKLPSGDETTVVLNSFEPDTAATYYCIFFTTKPTYPTRALFLSTAKNGDLGKSVIMDTR